MTDPVTEQQIDRAFYRDVAERYAGYGNPSIPAEHLLDLLDQLEQAERDRDRNLRSSRLAKEGRIKANARADQAEAELDAWMTRAYEAEGKLWKAEARIKAVEDVLDWHPDPRCDQYPDGDPIACGWKHAYADIRHALGSGPPPRSE